MAREKIRDLSKPEVGIRTTISMIPKESYGKSSHKRINLQDTMKGVKTLISSINRMSLDKIRENKELLIARRRRRAYFSIFVLVIALLCVCVTIFMMFRLTDSL